MSKSETHSPVSLEDRAYIISMIEAGWTNEEILECMPYIERESVISFRAHVSRGTYSQGDHHGTRKPRTHR